MPALWYICVDCTIVGTGRGRTDEGNQGEARVRRGGPRGRAAAFLWGQCWRCECGDGTAYSFHRDSRPRAFGAGGHDQVVRQGDHLDTLHQLTTSAAVTDVVPLPGPDRAGTSLGLLVQVLAIGAMIPSAAFGKLRPHTSNSVRRGIGHVAVLVVYALVSAAVVSFGAIIFGVIPSGELLSVFAQLALLSLALGASVAAAVALLGQSLPRGAGASLIRKRLYFLEASVAGPATVLATHAVVGVIVVMVSNVLRGWAPLVATLPTKTG